MRKNGSREIFGLTTYSSLRSASNYVASISSENVRNGIDFDSVINYTADLLCPAIYFTLKMFKIIIRIIQVTQSTQNLRLDRETFLHNNLRYLHIIVFHTSEWCNFVSNLRDCFNFGLRCWLLNFIFNLEVSPTSHIMNHIFFHDTTIFTSRWDFIYVKLMFFNQMSHSRS